jgi:rhamnosyltransferase
MIEDNCRPKSGRTAAGVVTFNPDLVLLRENLRSITPQVSQVIVFDNASENIDDVLGVVREFDIAEVIESPHNAGIATALNRISLTAIERGFEWLVTLDQDSVCAPGMVATLRQHADDLTPLVTPYIVDRNKCSLEEYRRLDLPPIQYYRRAASKGAITSGGLLNLQTLNDVGGFDERFFIDYVDYDMDMRLLRAGYRIARANGTYLLHQVGDARRTWLRTPRKSLDGDWYWETFYSFGHSSTRCYYKARNRVLYSRKYWRSIGLCNEGIAQIPQQVLLTLMFEKGRVSKLRAFGRGIIDGIFLPLSAHRQATPSAKPS